MHSPLWRLLKGERREGKDPTWIRLYCGKNISNKGYVIIARKARLLQILFIFKINRVTLAQTSEAANKSRAAYLVSDATTQELMLYSLEIWTQVIEYRGHR